MFSRLILPLLLLACSERPQVETPGPAESLPAETTAHQVQPARQPPPETDEPEETAPPQRTEPLAAIQTYARLDLLSHELPASAPSIYLSSAEMEAAPEFASVLFLHGWHGCVRQLVERGQTPCTDSGRNWTGWSLGREFEEAAAPALFVVPQLAYRQDNGLPGQFGNPPFVREWMEAVRQGPLLETWGQPVPQWGSVTVVAHSAGYLTALALIASSAMDIRYVVLLDALYDGAPQFLAWAAAHEDRKLLSLYTGRGTTYRHNASLTRLAEQELGDDAVARDPSDFLSALQAHRVVIAESPHPHGALPRRHLADILGALTRPRQ